ncbi:hypothetical protein CK203_034823 [Vitis vinifera]|uniref:Uncharacterized protein n=1 Tax=Vitis vinifera TaxID=29760 RepID=A0A438IC27_VITVI|nr:hypothetical protein CK203_103676 [Vitis vinifera]RVW94251.1 hypothetical protein CK203_034823 [Vitis vinifera]
MEGSADDLGAPESWEVADLDESMSRLMLSSSSSKKDSSSSSSLDASVPASASASAPALSSSSVPVGSGMISEDSVNQVDQFLREALQNPRERLSSELPRSRAIWFGTFTLVILLCCMNWIALDFGLNIFLISLLDMLIFNVD